MLRPSDGVIDCNVWPVADLMIGTVVVMHRTGVQGILTETADGGRAVMNAEFDMTEVEADEPAHVIVPGIRMLATAYKAYLYALQNPPKPSKPVVSIAEIKKRAEIKRRKGTIGKTRK